MASSQEIASLFARVDADVSGFSRGMDTVSNGLNAFEQVAVGGLRRVGEMVVNAGAAIASQGLRMAESVATTGISFDDLQEKAEIAFTTMLGSGEKAKAFLGDLQSFAAKTPFEFQDLTRASQRLMAMGFSADTVLPTMTAVGDAVAALGGDKGTVDRVITALGQMNAKGKTSAEEMMQLTEAGIPAWQMLADKIGKSIPDAMKMVTAGAVNAKTTINAVTDGMEKKFGGMMEKQSHTWSGLLSNIQDFFSQASGKVMKPFFEVAEKGLSGLVDWMSSADFSAWVDRATAAVSRITDALAYLATSFMSMFSILTTSNQSWGQKLVAVWDMVYQAALHIWTSLADSLTTLIPGWLDHLGEWAVAIWQWIIKSIPIAISKLGEWSVALFNWIATNLPSWVATLGQWAIAAWQWIVEVVPIVSAKIMAWSNALFNWVVANFPIWMSTLASWGTAAWQWLAEVIPQVATQIGEWGHAVLDWVGGHTGAWTSNLSAWATAAWNWLAGAVPIVLTQLGKWTGAIFTWLGQELPNFIVTLFGWATAIVKWIGDAAPMAIDALASFVMGLRGEGDGEGANGIGQMVAGWAKTLWIWVTEDALPKIGPAMFEFGSALVTATGNVLTSLTNLAVQLGKTLWQWIVDGTPIALAKMQEWGRELNDWLVDHSPLVETLELWGDMLWRWIANALGPTVKWLGDLAKQFIDWKDIVAGAIIALGVVFWPTISAAFAAIMAAIGGFVIAWAPIIALFAGIILAVAAVHTAWDHDFYGMRTIATAWYREVSDWFVKTGIWKGTWRDTLYGPGGIQPTLITWSLYTSDLIAHWVQTAKDKFEGWKGDVIRFFVEWKDRILSTWDEWTGPTVHAVDVWGKDIYGKLENAVGWITGDFGVLTKMKESAFKIWNDMLGWWDDHIQPWVDKGKAVIQGLWDGMKEIWFHLSDWFQGVWGDLTDKFKRFFGIASPSTVFAGYGENIMQGLANGLNSNQSLVVDAMGNISSVMTKASSWDKLGKVIGDQRAAVFYANLHALGANATSALKQGNVAQGNPAYGWANMAMNAGPGDDISTLQNDINNLIAQLDDKGVGITSGKSARSGLVGLSDILDQLLQTGNYSAPMPTAPAGTGGTSAPASGSSKVMEDLLKAILVELKKEGAGAEKIGAAIVGAIANTRSGLGNAVTSKAALR